MNNFSILGHANACLAWVVGLWGGTSQPGSTGSRPPPFARVNVAWARSRISVAPGRPGLPSLPSQTAAPCPAPVPCLHRPGLCSVPPPSSLSPSQPSPPRQCHTWADGECRESRRPQVGTARRCKSSLTRPPAGLLGPCSPTKQRIFLENREAAGAKRLLQFHPPWRPANGSIASCYNRAFRTTSFIQEGWGIDPPNILQAILQGGRCQTDQSTDLAGGKVIWRGGGWNLLLQPRLRAGGGAGTPPCGSTSLD